MSTVAEHNKSARGEEEIHLLDLGAIILKRWRTVLGTVAGTVLASLVIALLLPKTYTAHTVLLSPPSQAAGGAQLIAAQLSGLSLPGLAGGASSDQRLIEVIAKSRSLADSMVSRVESERTHEEEIREILAKTTEIKSNPDGSVVIEVRGEDRRLVAQVANEFPALLNTMAAQIGAQAALRRVEFLENQLDYARDKLVQSEQRLVEFQERQNAPEIQDQARRTIEAAAQLQQQIIEKEIQVSQLRRTATPDNPALRSAMAELNAHRVQLNRLTAGRRDDDRLFLSLGESPELKVAAARLMREFTKNEQVYVSLTAALADAQIEANNNLPVVSVLDPAIVPGSPSAPKVKLILALAALLGLVLGLIAAFAGESVRSAREKPENEPFFAAWNQLKMDVTGYMPRRRNGRVGSSVRGLSE
jgi:tyrosine-protein kinase Etk/Wzc